MDRGNLRELRSQARGLLGGDSWDTVDAQVIDDELNRAYRKINDEFGLVLSSYYATSIADKPLSALPRDVLGIDRVFFDDVLLDYTEVEDFDNMQDVEVMQQIAWTEQT